MKYIVPAIGAILIFALSVLAAPPLYREAAEPKIETHLAKALEEAPDSALKVWISFTDKGIFDQAALKTAADKTGVRFSSKAQERRLNRAKLTGFDIHDIPVKAEYIRAVEAAGARVIRQSRWLNAVSAYADRRAIGAIADLSFVAEISPVAKATRMPEIPEGTIPKGVPIPDSVYGPSLGQLALEKIPLVHAAGISGKGVIIAVFDTGFEPGHVTFDSLTVLDKYDFINDDTSVSEITCGSNPEPRHGTSVLSTIAGFDPGQLIGGAYGADFLLAKTEDPCREVQSEEDNWVAAAEWADSLGADIISSSLGYYDWYDYSDLDGNTAKVTIAADLAVSRGIAVFNAAGNTRSCGDPDLCFFYIIPPSDGDSVMAVGAVDGLGTILAYSSAGPTYDGRVKPDVVAQGFMVYCADYLSGYTYASGTSMATPIATSAAALAMEAHPDWGPVQVNEAMRRSANRYNDPDSVYGYGLFDAFVAADLFRIDSIAPIVLKLGDSLNLTVTVSGMEEVTPAITASNLPASAIFTDNGDRTAAVHYLAISEDLGTRMVEFTALSGAAVARQSVSFTVFAAEMVTAGPNPFRDSLTVFLSPGSEKPHQISVHSADGGKVWDNFSDNYNSTRGTVIWKGVNNDGEKVSPGVYYLIVDTGKTVKKIKLFKL